MSFSNAYTFGFATGICVLCSVAVAGAAIALKDQQDLNKKRDLHYSILDALQLVEPGVKPPGETIDRLWDERVKIVLFKADGAPVAEGDTSADLTGDGQVDLADAQAARAKVKGTDATPELLAVYQRVDEGQVVAYAIPVEGKGLWGPVSGYLALDPKIEGITGVTFFAPKETPGLGLEIEQAPFKARWVGKKVFEGDQARGITVLKAGVPAAAGDEPYTVDGLSGATITCRGVTEMVVRGVEKEYAATLARLKNGGTVTP